MKLSLKSFLFILLFLCAGFVSVAQKPTITKIVKFKPPVVKTFLGIKTNGDLVTKDEASQMIGLPLKITDDKQNLYTIDSYQFLYKRKGVIQDDETGRIRTIFTTVSYLFNTTPLPKVWIDNLKGGFQTEEELYFFDIVVKDKLDRKFFAPNLKILIQ